MKSKLQLLFNLFFMVALIWLFYSDFRIQNQIATAENIQNQIIQVIQFILFQRGGIQNEI